MNVNLNLWDNIFFFYMQGVFTTGTWEEKSDEISFADFKFSVTHHYLVQELSDKDGKEELGEGTS